MAMCLLQGLIEGDGIIDQMKIAEWYFKWYDDGPFDIGNTTRNAMRCIQNMTMKGDISLENCIRSIGATNRDSQSNGNT